MSKSQGQIQSKKQENRITKSLKQIGEENARRRMMSGALWFAKSDVVSNLFQIEAKTKAKPSKSHTIQKEWLDKIEQEAFDNSKIPALVFSFGTAKDYFALPDREFLTLVEELLELRKDKANWQVVAMAQQATVGELVEQRNTAIAEAAQYKQWFERSQDRVIELNRMVNSSGRP